MTLSTGRKLGHSCGITAQLPQPESPPHVSNCTTCTTCYPIGPPPQLHSYHLTRSRSRSCGSLAMLTDCPSPKLQSTTKQHPANARLRTDRKSAVARLQPTQSRSELDAARRAYPPTVVGCIDVNTSWNFSRSCPCSLLRLLKSRSKWSLLLMASSSSSRIDRSLRFASARAACWRTRNALCAARF